MIIKLSPNKVARVLLVITGFLTLAHLIARGAMHYFNCKDTIGIFAAFDMTGEADVPTYFSSVLLLICCVLLAVISIAKKKNQDPYYKQWMFISFVFLFLSLDESAMIHEMIGGIFKTLTHNNFGYFHWVIPYAVMLVILLGLLFKFLRSLPRWLFIWFAVSGTIYVGAAMFIEIFDGYIWSVFGPKTMLHALSTAIEEPLEMVGSIIFAYALMKYLAVYLGEFSVQINDQSKSLQNQGKI